MKIKREEWDQYKGICQSNKERKDKEKWEKKMIWKEMKKNMKWYELKNN